MIAGAQVSKPPCVHKTYPSIDAARKTAKRVSRNLRTRVGAIRCEECDGIMVTAINPRGMFDAIDIRILRYLAMGLRDRDIAKEMAVSDFVIPKRVSDMFQRSETNSRAQLVAFAISKGLVDYAALMGSTDG